MQGLHPNCRHHLLYSAMLCIGLHTAPKRESVQSSHMQLGQVAVCEEQTSYQSNTNCAAHGWMTMNYEMQKEVVNSRANSPSSHVQHGVSPGTYPRNHAHDPSNHPQTQQRREYQKKTESDRNTSSVDRITLGVSRTTVNTPKSIGSAHRGSVPQLLRKISLRLPINMVHKRQRLSLDTAVLLIRKVRMPLAHSTW